MKSLYVILFFFIVIGLFSLPVQAASIPSLASNTPEKNYTTSPNSLKVKLKKTNKVKKLKKVQNYEVAGILIFILGCMITLAGLGITIIAITDAVLTIGVGILVLGFVVMCIGDIVGNLGLMGLIFDLCDCISVLL